MRFGFHLSISRGFVRTVEQGLRIGCEAAQIFSRNPRSWTAKPISNEEAAAFHRARRAAGLDPLAVHLPYLPNLASPDEQLYRKSVEALTEDLIRADLLGADYLVLHPGHLAREQGLEEGLERVGLAVVQALETVDSKVKILLENTAGQKGELGSSFEQLAVMIEEIESRAGTGPRIGLCLDTAHAWAAGYDLASTRGQARTLAELDRLIGLDRLGLIHLNDSLAGLGQRLDRHAPVGRGRIGPRGLARFVRLQDLRRLAGIMETPRQTEADDLANMARVKRWRRAGGY